MRRGFLLGKFMPPHAGHAFLIDFARHHADQVSILISSLPDQPIPGALRAAWLRQMFPDCRVLHHPHYIPQEPADHPAFWRLWRDLIRSLHPEPIDEVFASEPYGHRLAAELGARFVPVDPLREAVPVSASAIRADPFAHWEHIPGPVRPYFLKRVCLFGPESTGKTTLARALARRFDTICVPEYGRTFTEAFGVELEDSDFMRIVAGHRAATRALEPRANKVLIMDTDPVLTGIWSEMLLGWRSPWFAHFNDHADLYLLCGIDAPWVDDGTRYFPDQERRVRFFELCEFELRQRDVPTVTLTGGWAEREAVAVAAVERLFNRP